MTRTYRKGDIVTIKAVVERDEAAIDGSEEHTQHGPMVRVKPEGHWSDLYIPKAHISLVTPHFEVGDRVGFKPDGETGGPIGTVKAVFESYVWVRLDNGTMMTFLAKDTVLLDAVEEEQVTA